MMQCGLLVAAGSYRAKVTRGIFTHFIREEDEGMTSGRLDPLPTSFGEGLYYQLGGWLDEDKAFTPGATPD